MENDWFKWDCPYYLKWREKLIEKTIWEGQQRGFDGKQLLEIYERVGYKHISLQARKIKLYIFLLFEPILS